MKFNWVDLLTLREDRNQSAWRIAQWVLIGVYALAVIVVIILHEPWADEAQAWLLAGGVRSPLEMLQYIKYEGSPILWHLLLYVLQQLHLPYVSIQVVNAAVMIAAAWVLVRFSRIPFVHKILILCSYPLLYEYAAISRSYSLMVLFAFIAMAVYPRRVQWSVVYLLTILLLSQTNFFGLIIAALLLVKFVYDLTNRSGISITSYMLTPVVGLLIAVTIFLLLPDESVAAHLQGWNYTFSFERMVYALQLLVSFFIPLSQWQTGFWNSIVFTPLTIVVSISAVIAVIVALRRVRQATSLYMLGLAGMWTFMSLKELQRMRFSAVVFILFILAWWIAQYNEEENRITPTLRNLLPIQTLLVTLVLLLQVVPVFGPVWFESIHAFSSAKSVAEVVTENDTQYTLVAYPQTAALSSLPYMRFGQSVTPKQFYALDREQLQSFALWDTAYYENRLLSDEIITSRLIEYTNAQANGNNTVVFISERKIETASFTERFELLAHYPDVIVDAERLYVYTEKK